MTLTERGKAAVAASRFLAANLNKRDAALEAVADALSADCPAILSANREDLAAARANGMTDAMLDRLTLTESRLASIADAVRDVVRLPDPLGKGEVFTRPNGLVIRRVRVPLGVVGIICEARPNVTVDAAALCLKSGNALILRGGSEAIRTNLALEKTVADALEKSGLARSTVQVLDDTGRETATAFMKLNGVLDVLIPRGGKGLIKSVVENATVPTIETGAGNCHIYVDETADLEKAVNILDNAKTQRPSVCNAAETLLVNEKIAAAFLPLAKKKLDEHAVEWRGDEKTRAILTDITPAKDEDYDTEYNDYILAAKVVADVKEAVGHINAHNTGHSEAIVTESMENAAYFTQNVDAAAVYVNASTRFTDGGEFGYGAEIGISTQKLHARGPMGLDALTTVKYIVEGNGQTRP